MEIQYDSAQNIFEGDYFVNDEQIKARFVIHLIDDLTHIEATRGEL